MIKKRLGVNIDHVATIRNARGEEYPEPIKAAQVAEKSGADSVTIHLREDRRHIRDIDLKKIIKNIRIPLNLEMAPTNEMLKIALKNKPDYVCIVPEKRSEITTEGGLDIKKNKHVLKKIIRKLKRKKIRVSLFVEPKISDIKIAYMLKADCVELHTGKFCNLFNKRKNTKSALLDLKKASDFAAKNGLDVHAGHGLTENSAKKISRIKNISELNIGHFIISDAVFNGLKKSIRKIKKAMNN